MNKRINSNGYETCKLSKDGKSRYYFVHRLVADAFIPNPLGLSDVNHIDFNRKNNCIDNLEWISHKDNVHYSISEGHHVCCTDLYGKNNPNYGNTTLKERFKNEPELREKAIARLVKYGADNNKAKAVAVLIDGQWKEFPYIKACSQFLIDNGLINAKLDGISSRISKSIKKGKPYRGLRFKFL